MYPRREEKWMIILLSQLKSFLAVWTSMNDHDRVDKMDSFALIKSVVRRSENLIKKYFLYSFFFGPTWHFRIVPHWIDSEDVICMINSVKLGRLFSKNLHTDNDHLIMKKHYIETEKKDKIRQRHEIFDRSQLRKYGDNFSSTSSHQDKTI